MSAHMAMYSDAALTLFLPGKALRFLFFTKGGMLWELWKEP